MIYYPDSSAIIPLFKPEASSQKIMNWLASASGTITISALSIGEVHAAFSREVRMGGFTPEDADAAVEEFKIWRLEAAETAAVLDEDLRLAAKSVLAPVPKLLMPDAIHLALCRRLGLTLVSFDRDLLLIAEREGVSFEMVD